MPSSKLTFPLWSASGTDPSQAAKQSPNQLLKPSHAHQCPIGSDYPANPPGKEEKGERKKKKKIELVFINVKQCGLTFILTNLLPVI